MLNQTKSERMTVKNTVQKRELNELTIKDIKSTRKSKNVNQEVDWKETLLNIKDIATSLFYIVGCLGLVVATFFIFTFLGVK